jgi:hydrogenase nickel incorporation protein HypB
MCATCGCSETGLTTITNLQTGRHIHLPDDGSGAGHEHSHDSVHHEHPPARAGRILQLEEDVLASNRRLAERNRAWFAERAVTVT